METPPRPTLRVSSEINASGVLYATFKRTGGLLLGDGLKAPQSYFLLRSTEMVPALTLTESLKS